jgi:hypothetical protein
MGAPREPIELDAGKDVDLAASGDGNESIQ